MFNILIVSGRSDTLTTTVVTFPDRESARAAVTIIEREVERGTVITKQITVIELFK
jgi:hypothetical protein